MIEAARQLRGEAGERQQPGAQIALAHANGGALAAQATAVLGTLADRLASAPMRVLLIGGGCRGLALTRELVADGHAVRAVTRTEAGRAAIEEAGAECWIGDPDVVGTLRYALENVTIVVWALGTASGTRRSRSRRCTDRAWR